jgi:hypothetical protein
MAIPLVAGVAWAAFAFLLVADWSSNPRWNDARRLAASCGAITASMAAGEYIVKASGAPLIDVIGKWIFNGIAILLMLVLVQRLERRRLESLR